MSGAATSFPLPTVESKKLYAPASVALEIQNLQLTAEGTLRAVRGPCPLIPDYGSGYPSQYGRMYGVYHALLDRGMRDVLVFRTADKLCVQRGYQKNVETLKSGLSEDPQAAFGDQFCEVGGKVIWCNGVDTPLAYDGDKVLALGYERAPGVAAYLGPDDNGHPVFRNNAGYSHPGKIGTVGAFMAVGEGSVLNGTWYVWAQFEDAFGNLSPLSGPSGAATLRAENSMGTAWLNYANYPKDFAGFDMFDLGLLSVTLDDLTKQFVVTGIPRGPTGTVARRLYRCADAERNPNDPRFLVRIPDNVTQVWPDNTPDAGLGAVADDIIPVPTFSLMTPYRGGLAVVIEGRVRISDAGFPGTFQRNRYIDPDPNGARVSGITTYGGELFAFTATSAFAIIDDAEGLRAKPITSGIGCVAPNSLVSTGFGALVWLGRNGFYARDEEGTVRPISEEIRGLFSRLNVASLSRATAVWNPNTQEYICAVQEAGSRYNTLLLCYDGKGWREQRHQVGYTSLCVTKDWRQYVIGAGQRTDTLGLLQSGNVFVLDHEHRSITPPTKTYRFRSQWLRGDAMGRLRFNVDTVYVGIVESTNREVTWSVYINGSRASTHATGTFEMVNPGTSTRLDNLVLNTDKLRTPRLTWKKFDVRIRSVESFAFDLSADDPGFLHLAAFVFDSEIVDPSGARVSTQ